MTFSQLSQMMSLFIYLFPIRRLNLYKKKYSGDILTSVSEIKICLCHFSQFFGAYLAPSHCTKLWWPHFRLVHVKNMSYSLKVFRLVFIWDNQGMIFSFNLMKQCSITCHQFIINIYAPAQALLKLTHLPLVLHICIVELGWHWFR